MTIAVIDYGSGNLRSAAKALERVAAERGVPQEIVVTADAEIVRRADRLVLPGVGAFGACSDALAALPGLREVLEQRVRKAGVPFLGICVGMQVMAGVGHEHGDFLGLDWVHGAVVPLAPADPDLVVPQMGWNTLAVGEAHPVLDGLDGQDVYFAHSYVMVPADPADVLATVDYGGAQTAAVGSGNWIGVQFHPEKSQAAGLRLLGNFVTWTP
ncbi:MULTISPECIES: imidazole glycerol phosphate synthase subunit HisH [unclassified Inquilinus]|uniref:imidazole glycerol phosphate synthase subunit HisH n=1 Tax=unclassified Inquilinus TaxID=2645927 RepID=UPI003F93B025